MPRADEPKRSVRLAPEDLATLEAASKRANVAVGALIRECVRRSAAHVAADVLAGRTTTLRRRSAQVPVPAPAAPDLSDLDRAPQVAEALGISRSEARMQIATGRVPGVTTARELAMARQRRLNEGKS